MTTTMARTLDVAESTLSRTALRAVRLHDDPQAAARAAKLSYVSDSEAGLHRRRCGRGFVYVDAEGVRVTEAQRDRIRALVIPPAWREVWICADPNGHLQVTGYDDRGRKQYLYHPRWRAQRDEAAFDRLALIGMTLPSIRADVERQLRRRTVDADRVFAGMTRLLDLTGIRVGNEAYERDNHTVGLTTLRWSHVHIARADIRLRFKAKSGLRADVQVRDRGLARLLEQLHGTPRQRVFRVGTDPVRAEGLNGYLSTTAGERVTAKDFRTWRGTVTALAYLRASAQGDRPTKQQAIAAIDAAAAALRNTRSVARAHYVHPGLIADYLSGRLDLRIEPESTVGLDADEAVLLAVLPRLTAQR